MSNNPYQSTGQGVGQQPYQQMQGGPDVAGKVSGPAIALMVVAVINILISLGYIGIGIMMVTGAFDVAEQNAAQVQQLEDSGMSQEQIDMFSGMMNAQGPINIVIYAITLILAIVILMGAMKMKNLKSYGMSMTASILAMIPCLSPCCLAGLPVGIWAIVVLNDMHVKNAFRANK